MDHFMIWIITALVLAVIEIATAGFVMGFFAVGAAITALLALFVDSLAIQLVTFLLSSIVCVIFFRPILKRMFNVTGQLMKPSNVDILVGADVLTLETVTRYEGRVKVIHTGEVWSAYLDTTDAEQVLECDKEGVITAVDGAKLKIKPKP